MRIIWNGKDITESVNVTGCVYRDTFGRADSLELMLDGAEQWYRWKPENGDEIAVTEGNGGTGRLYLNAVIPIRNEYRVLATSLPGGAEGRKWQGYEGKTLRDLAAVLAAECGMSAQVYGVEENLLNPWLERKDESAAKFMGRIAQAEGLALKIHDGIWRLIGIEWAQNRKAAEGIRIESRQEGVRYRKRDGMKWAALTVNGITHSATARDREAIGRENAEISMPVTTAAQAGRWARGILLGRNRMAEELCIERSMDLNLSAMYRIDVSGNTDANGEWIVDEAEHDIKNKTSRAVLRRVVGSIV